ncbi:hypothetical protein [Vibrio rhizosphaerae]|uniref:hypothetical protein n=1 Tax=Vibrio rhizosphaerae TaxID=398736 RepID=UPI000ACBBAB7|nr:hypothetical protein [Vibrio rhizosphaerae]
MSSEKVIAHQTPALQILSSQPWAPRCDAQLRFAVSEAFVLSAPVTLAKMQA